MRKKFLKDTQNSNPSGSKITKIFLEMTVAHIVDHQQIIKAI